MFLGELIQSVAPVRRSNQLLRCRANQVKPRGRPVYLVIKTHRHRLKLLAASSVMSHHCLMARCSHQRMAILLAWSSLHGSTVLCLCYVVTDRNPDRRSWRRLLIYPVHWLAQTLAHTVPWRAGRCSILRNHTLVLWHLYRAVLSLY